VDVAEKRKVCLENYDLIFSILLKIFQYKHERLQGNYFSLFLILSIFDIHNIKNIKNNN